MTYRNGRQGQRYNRAGMGDPRGRWAAGAPASAGFVPERGVRFAGTNDPLHCPEMPSCSESEARARRFSGTHGGPKLSRNGAPMTRLRHGMTKRRYSGAKKPANLKESIRFMKTSGRSKHHGLRRKLRK